MTAKTTGDASKPSGWGPVSQQVAANLARLRKARGLSTTRLSAALKELGQHIPPTGITRIEKGERRVDADDLTALALVLNVSPLALLLPPEWSDEQIQLTSTMSLRARTAWLWAEGRTPANDWATGAVQVTADDDEVEAAQEREFFKQREEYEALTHPPERRRAAQHPANTAADTASAMVGRLVRAVERGDRDAVARQLRITKNRLAQLQNAVEQIELEHDDA
ncbi:helix-turn-helix transcriptional regulator [Streptomyces sp. ME19-01-6]|uniref:helix-turn-helix domain-containing protein n=1 Tax=Streptomyces sp. ME19-01-6 TaxID=3028686 RepID=UPI0029BD643F|nr:helix-turn-helix transcriptional regulator [Streptomyces sp. ME19-01-6]MDX3229400.1 helix-turn-helix transcriptional regulator [Streptomyces sp. ME19-01-6]